jgi:signal transduction histidine kinase
VTRRASLRGWLLLSYLLVFSLPWIAIVGSGALAHDLRAQTREHLTAQGRLWALRITAELQTKDLGAVAEELADDLRASKDLTLCAAQIVNIQGTVLGSTSGEHGHSLADDPEVEAALGGVVGATARARLRVRGDVSFTGPSRFAGVRLFVAVPFIDRHGGVAGAVVMSRTPREEVQAFVQMGPRLGIAFLAVVAFTLALALVSGHFGSRSLAALARAARRIAGGSRDRTDLQALEKSRVREVGEVASAVGAMHAQLQARLDYIDEFAGNVAHEFRTPIATLRGTIELLHDDAQMPEAQRETFMKNAQTELVRLEALVDGLLALARAERTAASEVVRLGEVARVIAARHDVAFLGECGDVVGSAQQIEAMIENLVDNALRHGGETVRVQVDDADGRARVRVIDDGAGIAAADLPKVFDRFFTTDRTHGTGLGLALVRLVARTHGGDVMVTSTPGETVFTVSLPLA